MILEGTGQGILDGRTFPVGPGDARPEPKPDFSRAIATYEVLSAQLREQKRELQSARHDQAAAVKRYHDRRDHLLARLDAMRARYAAEDRQ